ncbi:hypothetical protein BASA81_004436 [Batrachochytrium salamandrivorans]|nr:hypothetical protein BASA81_004436 [Batrachochytrium salamandrivorans]
MVDPTLAFQCKYRGVDMCFFGGQCEVDPISLEEQCICPPGFGPDQVTFLSHNCTMPTHALDFFCLVFFCIWAPVLVLFYRDCYLSPTKNPVLIELARITLMEHIMVGVTVLGYFLQGGMYELAAIAVVVFFILVSLVMAKVVMFVLGMSHPGGAEFIELKRRVELAMRALVFGNTMLGIPVVLSRRTRYADLCVAMATLLVSVFTSGFGFLTWKHAQGFVRELQRSALAQSIPPRIPQSLMQVQRKLALYCVSVALGTTVMMLTRFTLGSTPFLYALILPPVLGSAMLPLGVASLFQGRGARSNKLQLANVRESGEEDGNGSGKGGDGGSDTSSQADGRRPPAVSQDSDSGRSGYDVGAAVEQHFE